jgi:hypothetical protein
MQRENLVMALLSLRRRARGSTPINQIILLSSRSRQKKSDFFAIFRVEVLTENRLVNDDAPFEAFLWSRLLPAPLTQRYARSSGTCNGIEMSSIEAYME